MSKIILLVLILGVVIVILLTHIFFIKREIKSITAKLDKYNYEKLNKKLHINLINKDIENLAKSINTHMEIAEELNIKQINTDNKLKALIANISHDIRTPLTSIIGYITMLKNPSIDEEKRIEYLDIVRKRGKDLEELLNKFFMLSVIESPEYKLNLEAVNLNEILIDTLTSFYDEFTCKNIEPNIEILKENIMVLGESVEIKRVIENLIKNSLRYSKGEVRIKLERHKNKAILNISNSVDSLKDKEAELIFDKFYKSSEKDSTGLGLPIVKELMIKMEGEVHSKIDSGFLSIKCIWNIV